MPIFSGAKLALHNHIFDGHQLVLEDCTGKIEGCVFKDCKSGYMRRVSVKRKSIYAQIDGGALLVTGLSKVTFRRCTFRNNASIMCGGAVSLQCESGSRIVFEDCTFINNSANDTGAAIDVLTPGQRVIIRRCTFKNNTVTGKLSTVRRGQLSIFPGNNVVITRCSFSGNDIDVDYKRNKLSQRLSINRLARTFDVSSVRNKRILRKVAANTWAYVLHPAHYPWV